MIVGIHHVALSVPDIDAAERFYVDALGFTRAFTGEWENRPRNDRVIGVDGTAAKVRMLRAANAYIELWEYQRPAPRVHDGPPSPADHGYPHICLQVTDIDAEHARLTAAGMTFHGPPVDLDGSAAIYGRDPWGNIIELYQVTGRFALPPGTAERMRVLEDIEAIRRLKAAYCAVCDDDHDGEGLTRLFVPDGVWATSMGDHCPGHDAMRAHFDRIRAGGRIAHSSHMVSNPAIDVDDDEAKGTWSMLMQYTGPDGARYRIVGFYRDRYERRTGGWKFRSLYADVKDYVRLDATATGRV